MDVIDSHKPTLAGQDFIADGGVQKFRSFCGRVSGRAPFAHAPPPRADEEVFGDRVHGKADKFGGPASGARGCTFFALDDHFPRSFVGDFSFCGVVGSGRPEQDYLLQATSLELVDIEVALAVNRQLPGPRDLELGDEPASRAEDVDAPGGRQFHVAAHVHVTEGVDRDVRVFESGTRTR
ncbi:MAG TPA: hypothetical protein VHE08_07275 [Solirubrobacterales bacterium]|nr:hypothetical protein [Solirubrobacterales bacterium]